MINGKKRDFTSKPAQPGFVIFVRYDLHSLSQVTLNLTHMPFLIFKAGLSQKLLIKLRLSLLLCNFVDFV